MLKSLVVLQQGNVKKPKKSMKMVNIEVENLRIFWMSCGSSVKLSGMMWLMIILKVKKTGLLLFFKKRKIGKTTGGGVKLTDFRWKDYVASRTQGVGYMIQLVFVSSLGKL